MAETSSLLNCRTGSRTGGSNPPPSAREFRKRPTGRLSFALPHSRLGHSKRVLMALATRSVHLTVRIQDSQSWHKGSIPLPTTKGLLRFRSSFYFPITKNHPHPAHPTHLEPTPSPSRAGGGGRGGRQDEKYIYTRWWICMHINVKRARNVGRFVTMII